LSSFEIVLQSTPVPLPLRPRSACLSLEGKIFCDTELTRKLRVIFPTPEQELRVYICYAKGLRSRSSSLIKKNERFIAEKAERSGLHTKRVIWGLRENQDDLAGGTLFDRSWRRGGTASGIFSKRDQKSRRPKSPVLERWGRRGKVEHKSSGESDHREFKRGEERRFTEEGLGIKPKSKGSTLMGVNRSYTTRRPGSERPGGLKPCYSISSWEEGPTTRTNGLPQPT